jgi:hypothetical protein
MTGPDPNEGRNDPMVAEHWQLGEEVQDKIRAAGYESEGVEGIAVDIHDILQAADRIRDELAPALLAAEGTALVEVLREIGFELDHIRWHAEAGRRYVEAAESQLSGSSGAR